MTVMELRIALQEYPDDTEVWLTEDFFGDPKIETTELKWKETTEALVIDGVITPTKVKVLCIT